MAQKRYLITADEQPDGYPPFVVDGVGVDSVEATDGGLDVWLDEAKDAGLIGVTWTEITDGY